ncbi:MAG: rhomboid family intramembrane serine protease, partial [Catenulispora sp.]
MRQIATMPDGNAARKLADYLLTLRIETRLDQEPDGWALWVCDEDRVPQARQELEAFTRDPADPRYAGVGRTADALRRQETAEEQEYRRRQVHLRDRLRNPVGGPRPVTMALILLSIAVAFATQLGERWTPALAALTIEPYTPDGYWSGRLSEVAEHHEYWRLVTPIFLHFGIYHILFNMLMLYSLGGQVEIRRGSGRLLFMTLAIAVTSNLAQFYLGHVNYGRATGLLLRFNPAFGGMSGVVYGLFGYVWMKARFQPDLGLTIHRNDVVC